MSSRYRRQEHNSTLLPPGSILSTNSVDGINNLVFRDLDYRFHPLQRPALTVRIGEGQYLIHGIIDFSFLLCIALVLVSLFSSLFSGDDGRAHVWGGNVSVCELARSGG